MEGSKVLLSPDSVQFKRGTGTRRTFSRFVSVGFRKFCGVCMIFETCMKPNNFICVFVLHVLYFNQIETKQTNGS